MCSLLPLLLMCSMVAVNCCCARSVRQCDSIQCVQSLTMVITWHLCLVLFCVWLRQLHDNADGFCTWLSFPTFQCVLLDLVVCHVSMLRVCEVVVFSVSVLDVLFFEFCSICKV